MMPLMASHMLHAPPVLSCLFIRQTLEATKSFFAEEPKLSMEQFFSRWALFLSHLEAAVANHHEDLRKRKRGF